MFLGVDPKKIWIRFAFAITHDFQDLMERKGLDADQRSDKMTLCFECTFLIGGRAFVPEEDENTCAVELVYRNQLPPPPPRQEEEGDDSVFLPPRLPEAAAGPVKSPLSPIVETSR